MPASRERTSILTRLKAKWDGVSTRLRNRSLARAFRVRRIHVLSGSYLHGVSHIQMGENFEAGQGLWMEAVTQYYDTSFSPRLVIGDNVSVAFWVHISAALSISIGDGVLIGSKVVIIDHDHGFYGGKDHSSPLTPPSRRSLNVAAISIGSNCWLADGVVVTAGSEIGEGAIIGANAVVKGRIPAFTLAVGIPAKPVKRFDFEQQQWIDIRNS